MTLYVDEDNGFFQLASITTFKLFNYKLLSKLCPL